MMIRGFCPPNRRCSVEWDAWWGRKRELADKLRLERGSKVSVCVLASDQSAGCL